MNKKFKIVLAILAVLAIIGVIMLIVLSNTPEHEGHTHGDDEFEDEAYEFEEEEEIEEIMPIGVSQFVLNYKGEWNRSNLYKEIYRIENFLPGFIDELENIKEEDLSKFFNDNKKYVNETFGLVREEDFTDLAKYLKEFSNIGEYKKVEILDDSYRDTPNYFKFVLCSTFENQEGKESKIILTMSFSNYLDVEPLAIYKIAL